MIPRGRRVVCAAALIINWVGMAGTSFAMGNAGTTSSSSVALGTSCHSSDPGHLCIALKYVSFSDASGRSVTSAKQALRNLATINSTWNQCSLNFEIDQFTVVDPADDHLSFHTANYGDLTDIRNAFQDPRMLLIVTTGAWDRSGSLGDSQANAWTSMPGDGPYGAIFEASVAGYPAIFAHELGHYLDLDHVRDNGNVMNAIIYPGSTRLLPSQCQIARASAKQAWAKMLR